MFNYPKKINAKLYPQKYFFAPEWLVLGVNNICNLHCKMCDVGLKNTETNFAVNLTGTKPLNMPLELIKKIYDQAAMYYPKVKIGYAFTEPLIYPHLIESLHYAKQRGLYTSITTNALTLKSKVDELIETKIDDIFISLDGTEEIHNYIRGHKSSFQRAIEGIEKLMENNYGSRISVFCVITEWNIGHLEEFVNFFKNYPIKHLGFMHTNFTNEEMANRHNNLIGDKYHATYSNIEEINIDNMDIDLLYEEIKSIKSKTYDFPVTFSPEINSLEKLKTFYYNPEVLFGKGCGDIYNNIMIKSDGSVIPAHGRCYNLTLGNLHEESLKEIWNSKVLTDFRISLKKHGGLLPACARCCSAYQQ